MIASETWPTSAFCWLSSSAWVSKPLSDTEYTRVGTFAVIMLATTSSCWASGDAESRRRGRENRRQRRRERVEVGDGAGGVGDQLGVLLRRARQ